MCARVYEVGRRSFARASDGGMCLMDVDRDAPILTKLTLDAQMVEDHQQQPCYCVALGGVCERHCPGRLLAPQAVHVSLCMQASGFGMRALVSALRNASTRAPGQKQSSRPRRHPGSWVLASSPALTRFAQPSLRIRERIHDARRRCLRARHERVAVGFGS